jgi:hypothetical protein
LDFGWEVQVINFYYLFKSKAPWGVFQLLYVLRLDGIAEISFWKVFLPIELWGLILFGISVQVSVRFVRKWRTGINDQTFQTGLKYQVDELISL